MAGIDRRRLVAGAAAGVAGLLASTRTGWPPSRHPGASAQSAFDLSMGTPGCSQVALMFNIGSGYEPAVGILDTLEAYGATSSMFIMGWLAEQNPWLVQQIAAWGHPVGSHGYVPPELTLRSDDDIVWDLQTASGALSWALGYDPGPWFTPYASASDERVRSIASSLGLITVGWSVNSGDWDPGATADSIYANVVNGAYDGAIIELHLDAPRSVDGTAVALPWIIDDLSARGYSFVTIPQIAGWC
ncbi:MAG TPA: polysaccharide deacetylase family protein [Thermomicrobiales bacterium]|nr:polysaccharide deacetylase family protein [Thermomicrobiales bacterium]